MIYASFQRDCALLLVLLLSIAAFRKKVRPELARFRMLDHLARRALKRVRQTIAQAMTDSVSEV